MSSSWTTYTLPFTGQALIPFPFLLHSLPEYFLCFILFIHLIPFLLFYKLSFKSLLLLIKKPRMIQTMYEKTPVTITSLRSSSGRFKHCVTCVWHPGCQECQRLKSPRWTQGRSPEHQAPRLWRKVCLESSGRSIRPPCRLLISNAWRRWHPEFPLPCPSLIWRLKHFGRLSWFLPFVSCDFQIVLAPCL